MALAAGFEKKKKSVMHISNGDLRTAQVESTKVVDGNEGATEDCPFSPPPLLPLSVNNVLLCLTLNLLLLLA